MLCTLRPQMSCAQVNQEAWAIVSATPRYRALKDMNENCEIDQDKRKGAPDLNMASRIMMPDRFPLPSVMIWLPLGQV